MNKYKKAILVYNPNAGQRYLAKELDHIILSLHENRIIPTVVRLDLYSSKKLEDFLLTLDYDLIIAAGGDGTVSLIAKFIIKNNIKKPFSVIGCGTCNNFASNIKMSKNILESIKQIGIGKEQSLDIGIVNKKDYFLSSVAIGIFADTSFETNQDLKEILGPFAYYLDAVTKIKDIKPNNFTIKANGKTYHESAYLLLILNGKNLGTLSNLFKDEINLDDGIFEMIIVQETENPFDIINILLKVLRNENFTESKFIKTIKSNYFYIDSENKKLAVSVDGEKGESLPLSITVKEKTLNTIIGK